MVSRKLDATLPVMLARALQNICDAVAQTQHVCRWGPVTECATVPNRAKEVQLDRVTRLLAYVAIMAFGCTLSSGPTPMIGASNEHIPGSVDGPSSAILEGRVFQVCPVESI